MGGPPIPSLPKMLNVGIAGMVNQGKRYSDIGEGEFFGLG